MTFIEISDLTTADSKLSAGVDSFLNELEKTETTQIFGGWRGGGCYEKGGGDRWYSGGWKKGGGGRWHNGGWKKDESSYKEKENCDYSYKEEDYKSRRSWKKEC